MAAPRPADPSPAAGGDAPLIGLSAWIHHAEWHGFDGMVALVEYSFVTKLRRCGAHVVIIPPSPIDAAAVIGVIDGLVLSGGEDIDPAHYGARSAPQTDPAPAERDHGDLALIREALQRDLPVLAICRGCQVLNVACGGTLAQHVPEVTAQSHQAAKGEPGWPFARHSVISQSPLVTELIGERFEVPSSHHQAVDRPGPDLEVAARAEDGMIEAIWNPQRRFVLGVQWHPETEEGDELFSGVVDAAAERRAAADPGRSAASG